MDVIISLQAGVLRGTVVALQREWKNNHVLMWKEALNFNKKWLQFFFFFWWSKLFVKKNHQIDSNAYFV